MRLPSRLRSRCLLLLLLETCANICASQTTTSASGSTSTQAAAPVAVTKAAEPGPSPASTSIAATPEYDPIHEANVLYRKGDFEAAIQKYQELLRLRPSSPDAYAGMARVYLKQRNVERAAETIGNAMKQSDAPRLHVALGEVLFRQGKIAEAEKEWVNVLNSGHSEARAYLGLARVRNSIAMYKSAKAMIDKAHLLDPNDSDIEDEWVGTLSRAERIQYLQDSLNRENNWTPEEREDAKDHLEYLRERAKQGNDSCQLVSHVTATQTPLVALLEDPTHLRGYGLAVVLNGHKSSLMLDTGASGILVRRGIAERAGISRIAATKVEGIGKKGRREAFVGVADSIKIGDLEFRNCRIEVMESRSVAGEDGLIGADVFEDFLIDLDLPNEKLKLSQLPQRPGETRARAALKSEDGDDSADSDSVPDVNGENAGQSSGPQNKLPNAGPQDRYIAAEMQNYTRAYRFGHNLLVPTVIGNVPYKLFLIDTGSLTNFISPAAAREVTKVHGDYDTIVEGLSGRVDKVYTANKAVLQFGHLRQENQDLTAFDTKPISDSVGTEVSGFLGFTTLRFLDIKIDYRDALVDFEYDSKRWNR